MKKVLVVLLAVAVLAAPSFAAEKKKDDGMAGKMGIGAGSNGLGVRYWLSDKMGIDGNLGFSFGDNTKLSIGGNLVSVLKEKKNLRFVWIAGLFLDTDSAEITAGAVTTKTTETDLNIAGGIGVEYSFDELPDLSFGAFLTGVGINICSVSNDTTFAGTTVSSSDSTTKFATTAGNLQLRYYLK